MDLLAALEQGEQRREAQALKRYVALLEAGNGDPKAVAELEQCMTTLGKTTADAKVDLQAIRQARTLQQRVADGSGLGDAMAAARKAWNDHLQETERLMAERNATYQGLADAAEALERRHTQAERSTHDLRDLKRKHAPVLDHIETERVD